MKISKYIEEIIVDMTGCDDQEASDMWENSEIGGLVEDYIQSKIKKKYGEGKSFSSATGGVKLEFDIEGIVDLESDTYYDLELNEVEF
jgi:hypothetical protein